MQDWKRNKASFGAISLGPVLWLAVFFLAPLAIVWAYRPEDCSLTAPKGPETARAGRRPETFLGRYRSAATVMPNRLWKVTFSWWTPSLAGKTLSHWSVRVRVSIVMGCP